MKKSDNQTVIKFTSFADRTLKFWENSSTCAKYPTLSKIAQRILKVPGSSSNLERMFSLVSKNLDARRSRLKAKTILGLVQIKTLQSFTALLKDSVESSETEAARSPEAEPAKKKLPVAEPSKRQKIESLLPSSSSADPSSSEDQYVILTPSLHTTEYTE